jgi:AcrR family transcriptional regulator
LPRLHALCSWLLLCYRRLFPGIEPVPGVLAKCVTHRWGGVFSVAHETPWGVNVVFGAHAQKAVVTACLQGPGRKGKYPVRLAWGPAAHGTTTSTNDPAMVKKREKSEQTLAAIVAAAMELTTQHGLHQLSLGDIAKQLGISKSGVFVRVGSLEALQLIVVEECESLFRDVVLMPALAEPEGLPRVDAVVRLWVERGDSVKALQDAHYASQTGDQSSALHVRIHAGLVDWRERLQALVMHAIKLGHLRQDTDASQLVFEILGLILSYFYDLRNTQDPHCQQRAMLAYARLMSTYRSFGPALPSCESPL